MNNFSLTYFFEYDSILYRVFISQHTKMLIGRKPDKISNKNMYTSTQKWALKNLTVGDLDDPKELSAIKHIMDNNNVEDNSHDCKASPEDGCEGCEFQAEEDGAISPK